MSEIRAVTADQVRIGKLVVPVQMQHLTDGSLVVQVTDHRDHEAVRLLRGACRELANGATMAELEARVFLRLKLLRELAAVLQLARQDAEALSAGAPAPEATPASTGPI